MQKLKTFEDLKVWQEAHRLVLVIYKITANFPDKEQFGLISQMRRCAVSVTSNIAEGFARHNKREKHQFYTMARGSLAELRNQVFIARDVGYINDQLLTNDILDKITSVYKLLHGLIKTVSQIANS